MFRHVLTACTLVALATAPALAALTNGTKAPDFTLQATQGGNEFTFSLADALKKGPVVLYFYPAAFTKGCTIEAHNFADNMDAFKKMNATVIGVSHDKIDKLKDFSTSACRKKFAVAADTDDQSVEKLYDAVLVSDKWPGHANRTSYVIAQDGTIVYSYTNLDPKDHVANLLQALTNLNSKQ